jgi:hypothetical protein
MKKALLFTILCLCLSNVNAQGPNINIPDANFKAYLVANFDGNSDGNIDSAEAAYVSGDINVFSLNIADLTGIEAFTAITSLYCQNNHLTSLNISANSSLLFLSCYSNLLTSLNLSANPALIYLNCFHNQLTNLDVSANTALTTLNCNYNQLTSLIVSGNTALNELDCNYNHLTGLDVSANTILTYLDCGNNLLMGLNLSANTALTTFTCYGNILTSLNVQNGNNVNVLTFDSRYNSNLSCIQVDNPAYSNSATNWYKDAGAAYSTNCPVGIEDLFSANEMAIYPNPAKDYFTIQSQIKSGLIEIYNTLGEKIYSVKLSSEKVILNQPTGIYFVKLTDGDKSCSQKLIIQ